MRKARFRGRAKNHQERAKRFGVERQYFKPARVFERDKWRCQLCGVSTPKRLKGTLSPQAPELDHIIPLSLGGAHVWDNVQCACRRCNGIKSNNPLGQLRLALGTPSHRDRKRNYIDDLGYARQISGSVRL